MAAIVELSFVSSDFNALLEYYEMSQLKGCECIDKVLVYMCIKTCVLYNTIYEEHIALDGAINVVAGCTTTIQLPAIIVTRRRSWRDMLS